MPWAVSASVGHDAEEPLHDSSGSQSPVDARQTIPDMNMLAGHCAELPVQFSGWSQTPAEVRHTVEEDLKEFIGHMAEEPVQVASLSQAPAAARQIAPAFPGVCVTPRVGSHASIVHGFPSSKVGAPEPMQTPDWQVSVWVQAFMSLQATPLPLAGFEQIPVATLHVPAV